MWIPKPVYESVPYFYMAAGVCSLIASVYLNFSYWPTLCFAVGISCLVAGVVVLLRRRDFRKSTRPDRNEQLK